jgi:hypothetical protein
MSIVFLLAACCAPLVRLRQRSRHFALMLKM